VLCAPSPIALQTVRWACLTAPLVSRTLSSICVSSPFIFSAPGVHRDLHSFPTRRSSDLLSDTSQALIDGGSQVDAGGALNVAARSEEHTSELQSRVDLVCRLLLEKKK